MTDVASNNPVPNRVCRLAQIDIPIIQAPMTYIAGARLAAAVSNAGALGIIETTSEQGRADLKRVRDLTTVRWAPTSHSCSTATRGSGPAGRQRHSLCDDLGR